MLANSNVHKSADDITITTVADSQTQFHDYLSNDFKWGGCGSGGRAGRPLIGRLAV